MTGMWERLCRAVGARYDGEADPVTTPGNWSRASDAVDALLAELREPEDGMMPMLREAARRGHTADSYVTDDQARAFWAGLIDHVRGGK